MDFPRNLNNGTSLVWRKQNSVSRGSTSVLVVSLCYTYRNTSHHSPNEASTPRSQIETNLSQMIRVSFPETGETLDVEDEDEVRQCGVLRDMEFESGDTIPVLGVCKADFELMLKMQANKGKEDNDLNVDTLFTAIAVCKRLDNDLLFERIAALLATKKTTHITHPSTDVLTDNTWVLNLFLPEGHISNPSQS